MKLGRRHRFQEPKLIITTVAWIGLHLNANEDFSEELVRQKNDEVFIKRARSHIIREGEQEEIWQVKQESGISPVFEVIELTKPG